MTDHEEELVPIYALTCACSLEDQQDEELHPEDAMGSGSYCLRTPIGTACMLCSEYADAWVDHIEVDDEDEDENEDEDVASAAVWVI